MFTRFTGPIQGAKQAVLEYLGTGVTDIDTAVDTVNNEILPMFGLSSTQQAAFDSEVPVLSYVMSNALDQRDVDAIATNLRTMLTMGLGDPEDAANLITDTVIAVLSQEGMFEDADLDFVQQLYQRLKQEEIEEAAGENLLDYVLQASNDKEHPIIEYEWRIVGAETPELRSRRAQTLYKLAISSRNDGLLRIAVRYGASAPTPIGYPNMRCRVEKLECGHYADRQRIEHFRRLEKEQNAFFRLNPISKSKGCEKDEPSAFYVAWNDDGGQEILCGAMTVMYYAPLRAIYVPYFETQSSLNPNIRGVGSEIMSRLIQDCEASDISFIFLFALSAAVPFYQKFGFVPAPNSYYMYRVVRAEPPEDTNFGELADHLTSVPRRIWRRPRGQHL